MTTTTTCRIRMSLRPVASWVAAALAVLPSLAPAQTPDRVRLTDNTELIGEILSVGPSEVEIKDQRYTESKRVPIDQLLFVAFSGEPDALRSARTLLQRQDAAGALEELAKIEQVELNGASDNVLADVAFVRAAATASQATATGADVAGAEKGLRDFLQKHPRSHHFFSANELLGELLVRAGRFDDAAAAYAALAKGPPALVVRAAMRKAESYYAQKKYAEAESEYAIAEKNRGEAEQKANAACKFLLENLRKELQKQGVSDDVLKKVETADHVKAEAKQKTGFKPTVEFKDELEKLPDATRERDSIARQKHEAQAGRARCLSRQGKAAEAIEVLQGVIREASPDDRELLGRAFTALGDAQRAAGKDQDALIAFLTVDLVYNSLPESHAEALFNLSQLWQKIEKPERAREAKQSLETSYPNSRWTKALAAAGGKG